MLHGFGNFIGTLSAGVFIRYISETAIHYDLAFKSPSLSNGCLLTGAILSCLWARIGAIDVGLSKRKSIYLYLTVFPSKQRKKC